MDNTSYIGTLHTCMRVLGQILKVSGWYMNFKVYEHLRRDIIVVFVTCFHGIELKLCTCVCVLSVCRNRISLSIKSLTPCETEKTMQYYSQTFQIHDGRENKSRYITIYCRVGYV